jgi:hypothetical protein
MVNRKNQHMIIGTTPERFSAVERSPYQIERFANNLVCQLFDALRPPLQR